MFSSRSQDRDAADPMIFPSPLPEPSKRTGPSSGPSIISADLTINGTLTSAGDVQIEGRVEGDVRSAGLIIGEKAFIQGEVQADDVTVRGRVDGSIRARKVLLCSSCHVEGNIFHEAFAVEAGAFFEGSCRRADKPLSNGSDRNATVTHPEAPSSLPSPGIATLSAVAPVPNASEWDKAPVTSPGIGG